MKDVSRKRGKLNDQYNTSTFTVVNITKTGNCVLMSNKSKEILKSHCPLSQVKKFNKQQWSATVISPDERTADSEIPDNSTENKLDDKATQDNRMDESVIYSGLQ